MRVPTLLVPVGLGTAAVLVFDTTARTAAAFWKNRIAKPIPDNFTSCGLSALLSLMERLALNEPTLLGVNFTSTSQEIPAGTFPSQG